MLYEIMMKRRILLFIVKLLQIILLWIQHVNLLVKKSLAKKPSSGSTQLKIAAAAAVATTATTTVTATTVTATAAAKPATAVAAATTTVVATITTTAVATATTEVAATRAKTLRRQRRTEVILNGDKDLKWKSGGHKHMNLNLFFLCIFVQG